MLNFYIFKDVNSNYCGSALLLFKEASSLTPIMKVVCDNTDAVFVQGEAIIKTKVDKVIIASWDDFVQALIAILGIYWCFDVAFPKQIRKTMEFLAGHICDLVAYKPVACVQKVLNKLYEWTLKFD